MDLIYRYAFAGRPLLPLQVLLAFGNFLAISYLLAKYAVDEASNRPVAVFLIFVTGVNYANMIDILHFNSHVFAFSFALLCSLFAFHAIVNLDRLKSRAAMALVLLASAQLLAASFAIYQPYAVIGLVIPSILLIKIHKFSNAQTLRYFGACAVLGGGRGALFRRT